MEEKIKPILKAGAKNEDSAPSDQLSGNNRSDEKVAKTSHIRFDEKVIQEHDKLRGTRQKIEEPKTPFFHEESSHDDSKQKIDLSQLEDRLQQMASRKSMEGAEGQATDEPEALRNSRHADFEAKRKQHYNEFQEMKRLLQSRDGLDEEDEEDEEEEAKPMKR